MVIIKEAGKTRQISIVRYLAIAVVMAMLASVFLPLPAFAATDDPDLNFSIDSVFAYQHCLESGDQLYLVTYDISYTVNPDENCTEAYLLRLMDGAVELGSVAPYAYYDEGYGSGVVALYFTAAEVTALGMTFPGAYTMRLEGNPTLTWSDGTPPLTQVSTFDSWSTSPGIATTQNELAARILYLADQLELDWGINMLDTSSTGSYLSDYGEAYFVNVIESLQVMAPGAFAGSSTQLDWETKEPGTDYADERAASVVGTPLDFTGMADFLGVSRMWVSSIIFIIAALVLLYFALTPTGNYRPLILLSVPLIVWGGHEGMIPMQFTVLAAVGAFILSFFLIFYHPSSA